MAINEGGNWSPTNNIVSPGVFTRENDLSGLAQGVANIGGAVVAPFSDGPAFFPTICTSTTELEEKFGVSDGVYYGPYTAKEYLKEQGMVTVVRVGGLTGYWQKNPLILYAHPGEWNKKSDIADIINGSFICLDSDNYTNNIQYNLNASKWVGKSENDWTSKLYGESGSISLTDTIYNELSSSNLVYISKEDASANNQLLVYNSSDSGKLFGVDYIGRGVTSTELNDFISTVSSNGYDISYVQAIAYVLNNEYVNNKIATLSSRNLFNAFAAAVKETNADNIVANHLSDNLEESAIGYDLATFANNMFSITGYIYYGYRDINNIAQQAVKMIVNISDILDVNYKSILIEKGYINESNYEEFKNIFIECISNSAYCENSEITFPLVFLSDTDFYVDTKNSTLINIAKSDFTTNPNIYIPSDKITTSNNIQTESVVMYDESSSSLKTFYEFYNTSESLNVKIIGKIDDYSTQSISQNLTNNTNIVSRNTSSVTINGITSIFNIENGLTGSAITETTPLYSYTRVINDTSSNDSSSIETTINNFAYGYQYSYKYYEFDTKPIVGYNNESQSYSVRFYETSESIASQSFTAFTDEEISNGDADETIKSSKYAIIIYHSEYIDKNGIDIVGNVTSKYNDDVAVSVYQDAYNINNTFTTVYFDNSTLKINGTLTAVFSKEIGTANLVCDDVFENNIESNTNLYGSELYSGKTINIGDISTTTLYRDFGNKTSYDGNKYPNIGFFYISSSIQGNTATPEEYISRAINESSDIKSLLYTTTINPYCTSDDPDTKGAITSNIDFVDNSSVFDVFNDDAIIYNAKFKFLRDKDSCGATLGFVGTISGSFGAYTGEFTPSSELSIDPCNPTKTERKPMILAVLANTLNTTISDDLEVHGFSGSYVYQNTSSEYPYYNNNTMINPNENNYTLELKYSYPSSINGNPDITGSYGYYDFSLVESENNYIKDVFGTNPRVGDPDEQVSGQKIEAAYAYILFEDSIAKFVQEKTSANGWQLKATSGNQNFAIGEMLNFTDAYSTNLSAGDSEFAITNAYTPWICSQKIAPWKGTITDTAKPTKYRLFRVHTLSDGTLSNKKYKIEISNVKLAGTVSGTNWGTFTLSVRSFSDTDKRTKVLETFQNLTLDPDSSNYIARRIGDYYAYIDFSGKMYEVGTYSNLSNYIRIEMADVNYPESVIPYGFEAYQSPIGSSATEYLPPIKYSKASIYSMNPGKYPSGTVFGTVAESSDELTALYPTSSFGTGVNRDTIEYLKPLPNYSGTDQNGSNIDFDLEDKIYGDPDTEGYYCIGENGKEYYGNLLSPELSGSIPAVYDPVNESTYVKMRKFIVGFQGGFDGQWPAIPINTGYDILPGNTQGLDCTNINSAGSIAYKQCISALGNADEWDINLLSTPGIFLQDHPYVCELCIDMCETRGDCFYVVDTVVFPKSNTSVGLIDAAINCISSINTNYAATYYPWVKILDTNLNKIIPVPPGVIIPASYARNDKIGDCWAAPAGLNRGNISNAVQVIDRLTHDERDTLYENRINPICAIPGNGIYLFGQKTLQIENSSLNRINVRRLLIKVKKYFASIGRYILFEANNSQTWNKLSNLGNSYLQGIASRNGLYAFKILIDSTTTTSTEIDNNIIYGKIYLQPVKSAEFLMLDFVITATGASFDE